MIVGQIGVLNDLREESPEPKRLVGGFEIQHKTDGFDASGLGYEVEASEKLLGNGEGCLPNRRFADLVEYPFNHIGYLERVSQITLERRSRQRLQVIVYLYSSFHFPKES